VTDPFLNCVELGYCSGFDDGYTLETRAFENELSTLVKRGGGCPTDRGAAAQPSVGRTSAPNRRALLLLARSGSGGRMGRPELSVVLRA
jgi:hypothetical protein